MLSTVPQFGGLLGAKEAPAVLVLPLKERGSSSSEFPTVPHGLELFQMRTGLFSSLGDPSHKDRIQTQFVK